MSRTPQEELVHLVSDMYSVEEQALAQLVSAPNMAGDPAIAQDFRVHHAETEQQAAMIRTRLEALGGSPSVIKNAVMKLGGKGFLLFARVQPETPGRLVAHAYSYEAMEWAGYDVLVRMAEQLADRATADVARTIRAQERTMMERLERGFDAAEAASHGDLDERELRSHVERHLKEAHAIESQSVHFLEKSERIAGSALLAQVCRAHLEETHGQARLLEERLEALGTSPSKIKDAALAIGGMEWGLFFQVQQDTPAKLAAFAYAVEHLEIAGYELLRRTAIRAQDRETEQVCDRILAQERAAAQKLAESFDDAVRATLEVVHA